MKEDLQRDGPARRNYVDVEAEGPPPPEAEAPTPAPARMQVEETPVPVPQPSAPPPTRQPDPELSQVDVNSLRQALSPATLSEPDVESPARGRSSPISTPDRQTHPRPNPEDEPPHSRPRLAEDGQASVEPNRLDDYPPRRLIADYVDGAS